MNSEINRVYLAGFGNTSYAIREEDIEAVEPVDKISVLPSPGNSRHVYFADLHGNLVYLSDISILLECELENIETGYSVFTVSRDDRINGFFAPGGINDPVEPTEIEELTSHCLYSAMCICSCFHRDKKTEHSLVAHLH